MNTFCSTCFYRDCEQTNLYLKTNKQKQTKKPKKKREVKHEEWLHKLAFLLCIHIGSVQRDYTTLEISSSSSREEEI